MLDNINTGYYGTKGSGKMAQIYGAQNEALLDVVGVIL